MIDKPMIDRGSATWMRISGYISKELDELQSRNEQPIDEIQTATIRGEIKALRALLALGAPDVDISVYTKSRPLY